MQFDITGFAIFLAFILPGFLAQKSSDSLVPRSLKPLSPASEIGEFVLSGIWVHALLLVVIRLFFAVFETEYFRLLTNEFTYGGLTRFLWHYRFFSFNYFICSLVVGYALGFLRGALILKQPIRRWAAANSLAKSALRGLGISGFLEDQPVWYFVLKQTRGLQAIFVDIAMKNGAGFYTGQVISYGILDDSVKSKDFYLEKVHFKQNRADQYVALNCDGLLLNFEDVVSVQVKKIRDSDILGS